MLKRISNKKLIRKLEFINLLRDPGNTVVLYQSIGINVLYFDDREIEFHGSHKNKLVNDYLNKIMDQ